MLKPTDLESLRGNKSRYAIVIGVAKRARELAQDAEERGTVLLEKPVSTAINEITSGNYKIVMR